MRGGLLVIWFLFFLINAVAGFADFTTDTIIQRDSLNTRLIKQVIESRQLPQNETVKFVNDYTRFGFKNLFSNQRIQGDRTYSNQLNPQAELFIDGYVRTHAAYLNNMKLWGKPYFNLIEQILLQYGLPRELKYIAVIESGLHARATSVKGAGGPWQFMPSTARKYGLTVNEYIDDRRDYVKSTHAAARFLLSLFERYHDWLLVMAAYNGGPGRVANAIRATGSTDFWKLQYHLPEESRTYVKRFIATHHIMEGGAGVTTVTAKPDRISDMDSLQVELQKVDLSGKYIGLVIAKNLSMDIAKFQMFNPDFDQEMAARGIYSLRLPNDKMEIFLKNKASILQECIQLILNSAEVPGRHY